MIWMLAGMAGLSALQAGLGNAEKAKQIKAQNKVNYAADLTTVANAGANIGSLLVQHGQLEVSAAKQYNEAEKAAYAATGTTVANAAAAQVKGASVDATLADIDREMNEAEVGVTQNYETGVYNLQQQVRQITSGATNALRGQTDPGAGQSNPLLAGLMSAGSLYAQQAFRFGSTKTST